jgi:hypothetical protein
MKESVLIFRPGTIYKRIIWGILCLLLLSTIVACDLETPEPPSPAPTLINIVQIQRTGVIVANVAVLRSGPGIDYERVGTLENGEDVKIVGKTTKGDWLLIEAKGYEENDQVWVSSDFVSMELDNEEPEEDEPSEPLSPDTPTSTLPAVLTPTAAILAVPTLTATILAVPTLTATRTPVPAGSPEPTDFLFYYWNSVSNKDYEKAWSLLTPSFKEKNHDGDIKNYIAGYKSMGLCRIELSNVEVITQTMFDAILQGKVTYYTGVDCIPYGYTFIHHMIFSIEHYSWQIDAVSTP